MLYVIYICTGMILGTVFCILFFRMDTEWKRISSFTGGSGSLVGVYIGLNRLFNVAKSDAINLFGCIIISFLVSLIVIFFLLCKLLLNNQNGPNVIRTLDIILGYNKYFDNYYSNRQKEIDSLLNFDELAKMKKELEIKDIKLKDKERTLNDIETTLDEALKNHPCILLPVNMKIPIDNRFMELLPSYIDCLAKFKNGLECLTEDFLEKYNDNKNDEYKYLVGYFTGVCTYISKYLFDCTSDSIRTHVRVLIDNKYQKLVAFTGANEFFQNLTSIPSEEGMIYESGKVRGSLIKSLNIKYHITGKNDSIWREYITFTVYNITENDKPFISMGISLKNRERYKCFLYFLSYYKIENVVQENVSKINNKCNIMEVIKNNINKKHEEVV